jgi:hypothetical protein
VGCGCPLRKGGASLVNGLVSALACRDGRSSKRRPSRQGEPGYRGEYKSSLDAHAFMEAQQLACIPLIRLRYFGACRRTTMLLVLQNKVETVVIELFN